MNCRDLIIKDILATVKFDDFGRYKYVFFVARHLNGEPEEIHLFDLIQYNRFNEITDNDLINGYKRTIMRYSVQR